jgi:hypothetical protein
MFCIGTFEWLLIDNFAFFLYSLNIEKRQREQAEHDSEVQRLHRQISQIRPSYPAREYEQDYAKTQDLKKRMSKFPFNEK